MSKNVFTMNHSCTNIHNFSNERVINIYFLSTGEPGIVLNYNKSERFECRWSTVKIEKSPSIMLKNMEDTVFGIWVAHGEGRFTFRNEEIFAKLKKQNCFAIKYTDEDGKPTERYPLNPNGSIGQFQLLSNVLQYVYNCIHSIVHKNSYRPVRMLNFIN